MAALTFWKWRQWRPESGCCNNHRYWEKCQFSFWYFNIGFKLQRCYWKFSISEKLPTIPVSPCIPSPCGSNADCRVSDNRAVCSCLPGMFGAPPNCRPECLIDQDCPLTLSCVGNKCKDPCTGSCGINARCNVVNHRPICSCLSGFEGDPFTGCNTVPGKWRAFYRSENIPLSLVSISFLISVSVTLAWQSFLFLL